MLNTKNKIHYFINIFFFVVFLLHVSLVAFNSMNPANPSLKVSKKKLEKLEYFPISLKLCAKKASSVDNVFRKFGYSHDYKFFIGKSYYNASIKGWNGHTRNGTTIASYTFLKATTQSLFSSPSPSPKSKVPKSRPKGLGLTLKSHGPPHPTPNF